MCHLCIYDIMNIKISLEKAQNPRETKELRAKKIRRDRCDTHNRLLSNYLALMIELTDMFVRMHYIYKQYSRNKLLFCFFNFMVTRFGGLTNCSERT